MFFRSASKVARTKSRLPNRLQFVSKGIDPPSSSSEPSGTKRKSEVDDMPLLEVPLGSAQVLGPAIDDGDVIPALALEDVSEYEALPDVPPLPDFQSVDDVGVESRVPGSPEDTVASRSRSPRRQEPAAGNIALQAEAQVETLPHPISQVWEAVQQEDCPVVLEHGTWRGNGSLFGARSGDDLDLTGGDAALDREVFDFVSSCAKSERASSLQKPRNAKERVARDLQVFAADCMNDPVSPLHVNVAQKVGGRKELTWSKLDETSRKAFDVSAE